jgi:hypothetical protein
MATSVIPASQGWQRKAKDVVFIFCCYFLNQRAVERTSFFGFALPYIVMLRTKSGVQKTNTPGIPTCLPCD